MPTDVSIVIGTRPEAIKCAPVVLALRATGLSVRVVASGQHAGLLDDALRTFGLAADVNLRAMGEPGDLAGLTARITERVAADFRAFPARLVLVQGDTVTTLAAALAAFYAKLPCGHIEAGLRSGRRDAPWPEEVNRRLVDQLCTRHYAPTAGAAEALHCEGIADSVLVTGQTGVDAALWVADQVAEGPPEVAKVKSKRLVYVTLHRRENHQGGIENVLRGVAQALEEHPDIVALIAAHPNPAAKLAQLSVSHPRLIRAEALAYPQSVWMISRAAAIVTDSGGIQEEAPSFGTPVLVARDVTERPEGLKSGHLRLVGTDEANVAQALNETLADTGVRARLKAQANPYGDGHAARRIAKDAQALLGE